MKYKIGIVSGVKNDVEIIDHFITHHLRIGFTTIHLMDFNSTDGSREVLKKYKDHPQVDVMLTDYDHGRPKIQQILRLRAYMDQTTDFILYLDPDEFIVKNTWDSLDSILGKLPSNCYEIQRYNSVLPLSVRNGLHETILKNLHKMYYFTPDEVSVDYPLENVSQEWIRWIKQPQVPKALHIKEPVKSSLGGHLVYGQTIQPPVFPKGIFIAHFPVTTYSRLDQKLKDFDGLVSDNPSLKKSIFTRYIHLCHAAEQTKTKELYEAVFLSKTEILESIDLGLITAGKQLLKNPAWVLTDDIRHKGLFYELSYELAKQISFDSHFSNP